MMGHLFVGTFGKVVRIFIQGHQTGVNKVQWPEWLFLSGLMLQLKSPWIEWYRPMPMLWEFLALWLAGEDSEPLWLLGPQTYPSMRVFCQGDSLYSFWAPFPHSSPHPFPSPYPRLWGRPSPTLTLVLDLISFRFFHLMTHPAS